MVRLSLRVSRRGTGGQHAGGRVSTGKPSICLARVLQAAVTLTPSRALLARERLQAGNLELRDGGQADLDAEHVITRGVRGLLLTLVEIDLDVRAGWPHAGEGEGGVEALTLACEEEGGVQAEDVAEHL